MTEPIKNARDLLEAGADLFEKTHSPATRAGNAVERAGKLAKKGVSDRTIASQLSDNSRLGQTYQANEIPTLKKLYADCVAGSVGITIRQATALRNDQEEANIQPNIKPA